MCGLGVKSGSLVPLVIELKSGPDALLPLDGLGKQSRLNLCEAFGADQNELGFWNFTLETEFLNLLKGTRMASGGSALFLKEKATNKQIHGKCEMLVFLHLVLLVLYCRTRKQRLLYYSEVLFQVFYSAPPSPGALSPVVPLVLPCSPSL